MTRVISFMLIASILVGCAGRSPRHIETMKVDDDKMTCQQIKSEMLLVNSEIGRLSADADKTAYNVAMGLLGLWFIIPLFFMDLKNAEKKEVEMYRQRYNVLNMHYMSNEC